MDKIEFDKVFSEYLSDDTFIKANDCIYELARTAFIAGWEAAMRSVQTESKK